MPESKREKMDRFMQEYGLPEYDAHILSEEIELGDYFETVCKVSNNPKSSSNWIMTEVLRTLKDKNITIEEFSIEPEHLGKIITLIDTKVISSKIAKELFEIRITDLRDPEVIVKEKGMVQVVDTAAIEAIVDEVLANNPQMVEDYKNSDEGRKPRVLKGIIGQAMKLSKGKANPQLVTDLVTAKLQG
jgi:aspartyl-tRNA(Asn)/glutamyl-tRNA(Gln) amidotransferase subunit B